MTVQGHESVVSEDSIYYDGGRGFEALLGRHVHA